MGLKDGLVTVPVTINATWFGLGVTRDCEGDVRLVMVMNNSSARRKRARNLWWDRNCDLK
jgi:hypothetical protein